jgi:hypothetical protein
MSTDDMLVEVVQQDEHIYIDLEALVREPQDVPAIWRDALQTMLAAGNTRFAIDIAVGARALALLLHYMRVLPTAECWHPRGLMRRRDKRAPKRREAMTTAETCWEATAEHTARLKAIAQATGEQYWPLAFTDREMRARRANWNPEATLTTPQGRAFIYARNWQQWLDITYSGFDDACQSTTLATSQS